MDIIIEAVNRLEERIRGSGSEDGIVTIATDPDTVICQFEHGACLRALYGGRSAQFVTHEPITAKTRIGFMFGSPLEKPPLRAAACSILNVVTGFFCLSRVLKSCDPDFHKDCLSALRREIGQRKVFMLGMTPNAAGRFDRVAATAEEADVILVVGDGLIDSDTGDFLKRFREKKQILFLSPSTSGVSVLMGCPHWCPYGKG